MRPAKFFLALLFSAAVLMTFLKLLFFALMAAAVFGTLFFAFRMARFVGAWRSNPQAQYAHSNAQAFQFGSYETPGAIDPRFFQRAEKQPLGRHIEVL